MSNVLTFPQSRTLAQVLAELMLAEGELKRLTGNILGRDPTDAEDVLWSDLEDLIWLKRDEAKVLIASATGVSWDQIQEADL